LEARPIAVIGINWGGGGKRDKANYRWADTEADYPAQGCGLADIEDSGDFGKQIQAVFTKALGSEAALRILNEDVFWTNRILVRSANTTEAQYQELLAKAAGPSATAIDHMLQIVSPEVVLCFGCTGGALSPSQFILADRCKVPDWQKTTGPSWRVRNSRIRRFRNKHALLEGLNGEETRLGPLDVWSFPHPAYGWCSSICQQEAAMKKLSIAIGRVRTRRTPATD
jgi:hypothetical protein